ncbi:MAG: MFS transporter [Clostridiaceae bacterium]|jgi:Na+/melibiose symporter-like transporter|nr:MFS transporter [Clostridiaceae bacterium]
MAKEKAVKPVYEKHMSGKEIWAYGLGLFGIQMLVGLLNSYQAEFFNVAMHANFALVGVLILIAKVVSAAADPFIGNLIDRSKNKRGKLKPFILYSSLPLLIITVLLFAPFTGLSGAGMYSYIFFMSLLWCIAMAIGDVPSQAIAAVMTPSNNERVNVVTFANTLKSIGIAAPAVVVPLIGAIVPGGAGFFDGETLIPTEYLVSAIVTAILGCGLFLCIFFFSKERIPYKPEKMNLKDMFGVLKNNKYLLIVFISYFLGFGRQAAMGINLQTARALLGDQGMILVLGLPSAIGTMVSMILTPVLIKKFDERKVYIGMSLYGLVISIVCFFVAFSLDFNLSPTTHTTNLIIMIPVLFAVGLQFGAVNILPMIMVADSVDYYEHKTGKRTEGVSYAVLSLAFKVTLAMGTALALIIVGLSGYDAVTPAGDITYSTKLWVFVAYMIMPGVTSALCAIPVFFYDFVGEKKNKILAELKARRTEAEASANLSDPAFAFDGTSDSYSGNTGGDDNYNSEPPVDNDASDDGLN